MTRRQSFTVGAVAGLILWPLLAVAITVAASIGNEKRRRTLEAHRAETKRQRDDWDAFTRAHPELAGEGS